MNDVCVKKEGAHLSAPRVTSMSKCVASYLQAFVQESANSQVAQESATQQESALQQESTTQQVSACSHAASLHFLLLQHELIVRAATATITNNTFFIFFACFKFVIKNWAQNYCFFLLFYRKLLIIL